MLLNGTFSYGDHIRWNLGWPTPNFAAAALATALPWVWAAPLIAKKSQLGFRGRIIGLGALVGEGTIYFLLCKTYSRGGLVALLIAAFSFATQTQMRMRIPRMRLVIQLMGRAALVMTMICATGFYGRITPGYTAKDGSVLHRYSLWTGGLKMIASAPLAGWGSYESGRVYMDWFEPIGEGDRYTTMVNSYLTLGVEHGLFCFGLVTAAIWFLAVQDALNACAFRPRYPRFDASYAAARASLAAWFAANCFTTLWVNPWIWIIPAFSIALVLHSKSGPYRCKASSNFLYSIAIGSLISILVYGIGCYLAKNDPIKITPGENATVILQNRRHGKQDISQGKRRWNVWADRSVLGPFPGHEIRQWALGLPEGSTVVSHPIFDDCLSSDDRGSMVFLFGRQVQKLYSLLSSEHAPGYIWIFHPFGPLVKFVAAEEKIPMSVLLPSIDQLGQNQMWDQWARECNARRLTTRESGIDIRANWPGIASGIVLTSYEPIIVTPKNHAIIKTSVASEKAPPLWHLIEENMHSMAFDGTLKESLPLGSSPELREFKIRFRLEHRIGVNGYGKGHSVWEVPAVVTWLAPSGPTRLAWQPPNGSIPIAFDLPSSGTSINESELAYNSIARIAEGIYEIRSTDGTRYEYEGGCLVRLINRSGAEYLVQTRGGLITKISRKDDPFERSIISADYNQEGHPVSIVIGSKQNLFVWNRDELSSWKSSDVDEVKFSYSEGLLSEISVPEKGDMHFVWAETRGFMKGASRWTEPVHLKSDNLYDYDYSLSSDGFEIKVTRHSTGKTTLSNWNPYTLVLIQRSSGHDTLIVRLSRATSYLVPIEIQDQDGNILFSRDEMGSN